ncbi:MAG TPA: glycosyl hydrolase [Acidobacteriota bacterium]
MNKNSFLRTLVLISICAGLFSGHTEANVQQRRSRPQGQIPQASPPDKTQDSGSTEKAQKEREPVSRSVVEGLKWREIGPAAQGGRTVAFAVDPANKKVIYAATATGGLWKTINNGTTWTAVFSREKSVSLGDVAVDPSDSNIVWVGTGEPNNQRSSSYGDGVYKSVSGGRHWQHMGLEKSGHVGRIVVHPKDGNIVYVAVPGLLWGPSAERGLFKTADGGKTWDKVLYISNNTGVVDLVMDPRDANVLYAAAYQRRRHDYTFVGGGPESGIYKSVDAGKSWTKLTEGLPAEDKGRIGLAIAASNPDTVYAIVEARQRGGLYRSTDRGATWEFRNGYNSIPWYFGQVRVDPKNSDRVYVLGVPLAVSSDGGRTFRMDGARGAHSDQHALWIDPDDTNHMILGNDGGVYFSYDKGETWDFMSHLPIGQFYTVVVDNRRPFYYVYGGLQDNQTLGGPSRTWEAAGITNADWQVVTGGDGFYAQVDPQDSTTVYGESQYGNLLRFNTETGEHIGIQPKAPAGESEYRWNWSAPLLISPHNHTTLYFAANKLFKSIDRGNSWQVISPDLSRQIDREKIAVMDKVWDPKKTVAYNEGIARYGNISSLDQSRLQPGLLYVGTDDGLIQISRDDGKNWTRVENFPGVPERTYVTRIVASRNDPGIVYATFNNHRNMDFKPYVYKSADQGRTWTSITSNLPEFGSVHVVREHHRNPNLLFVGTEFGAFFSIDGGQKWTRFGGGLPTVPVHDIAIQERENDLVLGTHGRGFWVLDDVTPLEKLSRQALESQSLLFPVRDALLYSLTASHPAGAQAERFFAAKNPEFGALISYYLKEDLQAVRKKQKKSGPEDAPPEAHRGSKASISKPDSTASEQTKGQENMSAPKESSADAQRSDAENAGRSEARSEDDEEKPIVSIAILDATGRAIRKLEGPTTAGLHRVTWDLAYPPSIVGPAPAPGAEEQEGRRLRPRGGAKVLPGTFQVRLEIDGKEAGSTSFQVTTEGLRTMPIEERAQFTDFLRQVTEAEGAEYGSLQTANRLQEELNLADRAIAMAPAAPPSLQKRVRELIQTDKKIIQALRGKEKPEENDPPSISGRISGIGAELRLSGSAPTDTQRRELDRARLMLGEELKILRGLVEKDIPELNHQMDAAGVNWTPGRVPKI